MKKLQVQHRKLQSNDFNFNNDSQEESPKVPDHQSIKSIERKSGSNSMQKYLNFNNNFTKNKVPQKGVHQPNKDPIMFINNLKR